MRGDVLLLESHGKSPPSRSGLMAPPPAFASRRSISRLIEDGEGTYPGRYYGYAALNGKKTARIRGVDRRQRRQAAFRGKSGAWLAAPGWPRLDYRLRDG